MIKGVRHNTGMVAIAACVLPTPLFGRSDESVGNRPVRSVSLPKRG